MGLVDDRIQQPVDHIGADLYYLACSVFECFPLFLGLRLDLCGLSLCYLIVDVFSDLFDSSLEKPSHRRKHIAEDSSS